MLTTDITPDIASATTEKQDRKSTRLISLDALRGLTILLMLLVNNIGQRYAGTPLQLRHAGWHGVHLADLAFPWFLFCAGVAIPFSAASFRKKCLPKRQYLLKVLRRVMILLAIGALLDTLWDARLTLFSVGVLQTIALAYAVGALAYDLPVRGRLAIATVLLVGYWGAVKFLAVPGAGVGVFTESQNLILHLNRHYLGQLGLWGLTRLIPTTALLLIGTAIGDMVRSKDWQEHHTLWSLFAAGIVLTAGGYLWNLSLPFNKPVWTPSYVLFAAGVGTLLLGLLYLLADILGHKSVVFPLVVFGSNAILIYTLPIFAKALLAHPLHIYIHGWVRVIPFILFWWLVAWQLYRKKIFLKV